ncbi:hypothetical protein Q9L58_006532 [Maublancomyces gigas]|uniref:H-type lectin domain-containing protein n=1 Tax=Discina gigas TaxID=1032678 RepID=A0ABR3GF17_9PEZI
MVPLPPYPPAPADLETTLDDKSSPLGASQLAHNKHAVELGKFMKETSATGEQLTQQDRQTVHFSKKYAMIPGLVVGLTLIDISLDVDMRAKANLGEIQRDQFQITLNNWDHTNYRYGATGAYLGIEACDPEFQYGGYRAGEDYTWTKTSVVHNTRPVTFKRAYEAPPKVVVLLNIFDIDHAANWCVKCFATDLTATGFTMNIVTGSKTKLSSEMASWIAYPADRLGVASGSFSSLGTRTWMTAQVYNRGFEPFGSGVFDKPPRVFLALNALDTSRKQDMRLLVKADNVSAAGMAWHLDTWADKTLYSAGSSYIAFS